MNAHKSITPDTATGQGGTSTLQGADPLQGVLFIGDPHLSSRRPGRRTDVNFAATVLDKLAQAFQIARDHAWQPVILGDLFDRAGEQDLMVLSGLLHLLRDHRDAGGAIPVTLAGNHDLKDATLSGDTALSVIHESGLLRVLEDSQPLPLYGGSGAYQQDEDMFALLLPYSYGQEDTLLQNGYGKDLPQANNKVHVIALTHADFAFAGAYPGAKELIAIPGVDMVVNGHMHKLCPAVRRKNTLWWNPGNITRMSMDCESHAPRVWSWAPGEDTLTGHVLRHEKFVFDRTGVSVGANVQDLKRHLREDAPLSSQFVALLKEQQELEVSFTEDGSGIRAELEAVCQEQKVDVVVLDILQGLLSGQN